MGVLISLVYMVPNGIMCRVVFYALIRMCLASYGLC